MTRRAENFEDVSKVEAFEMGAMVETAISEDDALASIETERDQEVSDDVK
jgi:hypothetical protein